MAALAAAAAGAAATPARAAVAAAAAAAAAAAIIREVLPRPFRRPVPPPALPGHNSPPTPTFTDVHVAGIGRAFKF